MSIKTVNFVSKEDGVVLAYESTKQPGLFYYVTEWAGFYSVVAEVKGYPVTSAWDDDFLNESDAMEIAKQLAEGKL